MKFTLTTAPTTTLVTLAEARSWINAVDGITEDDDVIQRLVDEAISDVEHFTNRKILTQTWTLQLDWSEVSESITLPLVPLVSVSSIKTTDDDGDETTVTSTNYQVRAGENPRIVLTSDGTWPDDARDYDSMAILCVCGYGGTVVPGVGFQPADPGDPGHSDITAALSDTFDGTARTVFEVKMTGASQFDWRAVTTDANGQKTYGAWTSDVAITGAAQALANNVTVEFNDDVMYTTNDQFNIEMYEQLPYQAREVHTVLRGVVSHLYESKGAGVLQTVSGQLYNLPYHFLHKLNSLRVHPF